MGRSYPPRRRDRNLSATENVAISGSKVCLVFCDFLRPVKNVIEPLCTVLVSLDVRLVAKAVSSTNFCGAFIVAKYNDFDVWI